MARKIRHQPRIKGVKRLPVSAGVLPQLKAWLDREARMYGVSRAFVQANCVSFVSGIPMENYRRRPHLISSRRRKAS